VGTAVRVLVAAGAIYLVWLAAVNVLLQTRALRWLMARKQDHAVVEYESAWAAWPTYVHVRGLKIDIVDSTLRARVSIDEAVVNIDVVDLLSRTFHGTEIDATGVSFWLRQHRLEATYAADAEGLPPLGPYPPVPIEPSHSTETWRIKVRIEAATGKELWIDTHRLRGPMQVAGALDFHLQRSIAAEADVALHAVEVDVAGRRLVDTLSGTLVGELAETDVSGDDDEAALIENTVAHGGLVARVDDVRAATYYLPPGAELLNGSLWLVGGWGLRGGEVTKDTALAFWLRDVIYRQRALDVGVNGVALVDGRARGVRVSLRLRDNGRTGATVRLDKLVARIQTEGSNILETPRLRDGRVKAQVTVNDLRAVQRTLFPDTLDVKGGRARVRFKGAIDEADRVTASARVRLDDGSFAWEGARYTADASLRLDVDGHGDRYQGKNGRLDVARLAYERGGKRYWGGQLTFADVEADRDRAGRRTFRFTARGKLSDANPIVAMPPIDDAVPDVAVALTDLEDLTVDAGFSMVGDRVELKLYCADTDGVSVRGRLVAEKRVEGAFLLEKGPLEAGITVGKKSGLRLYPGDDFGKRHFARLGRRGLDRCDNP
jgi:hypothetical protein